MSDINFCNTKEQLNHLGEVVTGKVNGSPTGDDIETSILPYTGQVRKTLPALEAEYEQSITSKEAEADSAIDEYRLLNKGPYSAGITLESKFEYITYNGESYFALNPPYTTTATTPDADGNLFAGGYTTVETVANKIGNPNLLSNSNFLTPSPDAITHPNPTPESYVAGTQIFSGVYAGSSGATVTLIDGRVNCSAGSYEYRLSNINGLDRVPVFASSVSDYDGNPVTTGVSHSLSGNEYLVTVTPATGDVFSVKLEQGDIATRHDVEKKELSVTVSDVYGMRGDGEFNNTNLMIKAIRERLFIDFDSGTYLFDTTPEAGDFLLYLGTQGPLGNPTNRNGMHIKGRGLSTVIKLSDNVGPATLLFGAGIGDELEDMVFEDLVFDLNGQNNLQNDYSDPLRYNSAFYFFCKCSRIKFKNVYIKNGSGHQLIRIGGDTTETFGDDIEFDVTIDTCGRAIAGNLLQDISAVYCQASNVRGTIRGINPDHPFDLSRGQTLAELHVDSLENINIYAEQFQLPWLLVAALRDVDLVHINSCVLKDCNYIGSLDPAGTFAFKDIRIDGLIYSSAKVTSNLFVFGAPGEQPKSRELITMNSPVINGFGSSGQDTHVFRIEDSYLRDFTINNPRVSGLNGSLFFVSGEIKNTNTATISIKGGVLDSLGSTGGIFPTTPSMIDFSHSSGIMGFLDITDITFLNTALKNYGNQGPVYLNGAFNRVGVRGLTDNMENNNTPLLNLGANYSASRETHEVRESKYASPQFNLPGNTTLNLIGLRDVDVDDYAALTIRLVGTTGGSSAISATYAANWDNGGGTVSVINESGVYAPDITIQWVSQFLQVVSTTATPINFRLFVDGISTNNFTRSV